MADHEDIVSGPTDVYEGGGSVVPGSDGTVGGPGGTPLSPSVVSGSPTGGALAWAANTEYKLNNLVTNGGVTSICTTAHKSGATFDSTKFQSLGVSSGPTPFPGVAIADRTWVNAYDGVLGGFFRSNSACVYTAIAAPGVDHYTDIRPMFYNQNGDSIASLLDTEFQAAIEYPIGATRLPFTFGKRQTAILAPGAFTFADALPVKIPAGAEFAIWVYTVPNGSGIIRGPGSVYTGTLPSVTNTDRLDLGATSVSQVLGGTITNAAAGGMQAPQAIFGQACYANGGKLNRIPQPLVIGDSISQYGNDDRTALRHPGWVNRWMFANNVAVINVAKTGENAQAWGSVLANQLCRYRQIFLDAATAVLYAEGANDIGTRTPTQLTADALACAEMAQARGLPFYAVTVIVHPTSSSDGWKTVANQVVNATAEGCRVPYNNWLRCGAPIDPATKLPVVGVGTLNGTKEVTSASKTFVNGQTISGKFISPGTTITAGGGTETLTLSAAATGSASGQALLAGALTAGSTGHPMSGYIEVANLVESAQDSGKWAEAAASGTATWTNNSASLKEITTSSGAWENGQYIVGAGIPAFTTINSLNIGAGTATMSYAGTPAGTNAAVYSPFTTEGQHPSQTGIKAIVAGVSIPAALTN